MQDEDVAYMERALDLGRRGRGRTSPNPMVGAVVVNDGEIVGEGYHEAAGRPHAEAVAIAAAGDAAEGGTLYANLEPCDHRGRTPPCTESIIDAGIDRVVVATYDPNPESGNGVETLEAAGVETDVGTLDDAAASLNEVFLTRVREGRPFVVSKAAVTLDGKIATKTGSSQWISNRESRRFAHELRDRYDAILVGSGTVLADDPRLTARLEDREARNPVRVVLDPALDVPLDAALFSEPGEVVVATLEANRDGRGEKLDALRERDDVDVVFVPGRDVSVLLSRLAERSITSVLVEGGAAVNWSFHARGLVDKLQFFVAPKIVGGRDAVPVVGGDGFDSIDDAVRVSDVSVERLGDDVLITGYPNGRPATWPATEEE